MVDNKDLDRLQKILIVLVEEGLGYYVSKAKLNYHLPFTKRLKPSLPLSDKQRQAIRIRRAFERLGPTFIKFGQLLSLRPDLVPKEYSQEFQLLQDKVPPFSYQKAKKIIQEDLKRPLKKIFKRFDREPFASASIAQVHKAVLKSGRKVAVKVQRPDVREIIDSDLEVLFHLAQALEKHFPDARDYNPVEVIREFALWTRRELNFEIEANNAVRLGEECKKNKRVKIPKIYTNYSSKRVLTMEFIDGVKINNLEALDKFKIDREKLVMTYFTSILDQALLKGLFHADPHPANIFVQKNGKLVYLDYGIMGELKPADRKKILRFISSIDEKDPHESIEIIISLAKDVSRANLPAFRNEALTVLEDVYRSSIEEISFAHAFYQIIALGAKHKVVFDPNHVLVAKAVYQAEGISMELYPKFRVSEGLKIFSKEFMQDNISPAKLLSSTKRALLENKNLLADLPDHISKIIRKLEQPEHAQELNVNQLKEIEQELEYMQKRRTAGMMIAALIVSSAILFYVEGRTSILGLPVSVILFILTLLMLFYFIISSRKKTEGN